MVIILSITVTVGRPLTVHRSFCAPEKPGPSGDGGRRGGGRGWGGCRETTGSVRRVCCCRIAALSAGCSHIPLGPAARKFAEEVCTRLQRLCSFACKLTLSNRRRISFVVPFRCRCVRSLVSAPFPAPCVYTALLATRLGVGGGGGGGGGWGGGRGVYTGA